MKRQPFTELRRRRPGDRVLRLERGEPLNRGRLWRRRLRRLRRWLLSLRPGGS